MTSRLLEIRISSFKPSFHCVVAHFQVKLAIEFLYLYLWQNWIILLFSITRRPTIERTKFEESEILGHNSQKYIKIAMVNS